MLGSGYFFNPCTLRYQLKHSSESKFSVRSHFLSLAHYTTGLFPMSREGESFGSCAVWEGLNDLQLMNFSHTEKYLNANKHLNLNLE